MLLSVMRHPGYLGWLVWAVGMQLLLGNPICMMAALCVVRSHLLTANLAWNCSRTGAFLAGLTWIRQAHSGSTCAHYESLHLGAETCICLFDENLMVGMSACPALPRCPCCRQTIIYHAGCTAGGQHCSTSRLCVSSTQQVVKA